MRLADAIGVSYQTIHSWTTGRHDMLARHAASIEEATNGQVTALEIGLEFKVSPPARKAIRNKESAS